MSSEHLSSEHLSSESGLESGLEPRRTSKSLTRLPRELDELSDELEDELSDELLDEVSDELQDEVSDELHDETEEAAAAAPPLPDSTIEEIKEYRDTINKRDIEIIYLKEMIMTLTANTPAEKEETQDAEQISNLKDQISKYESTMSVNAIDMEKICEELCQLKCVIVLYESQITELTNSIASKDQIIASNDEEISQLKTILTGKDAEIAQLKSSQA